MNDAAQEMRDWWRTEIIEMEPGVIRYRGYPIEELIGNVSFAQMIWLMVRGEPPSRGQAELLDTALMAAVDHGPQAPSIAIARMAVTCGVDLNNAMASAINVLGDVHGGAGEQAVEVYRAIEARIATGLSLEAAVADEIGDYVAHRGKHLPGFGHRFHPIDPRAPRLLKMGDRAVAQGIVGGRFAAIGRRIEGELSARVGKRIPMNIDGATAVIYSELGFSAPLTRGLFCLSRSVGILAHAWEQMEQGGRNKGPIPRQHSWSYAGPKCREVPKKS